MKKTKKHNRQQPVSVHTVIFITIFVLFAILMYAMNMGGALFKTSVVSFPEHAPFDGTAYPVKKVLNWVKAPADKWTKTYSELSPSDLVDFPAYDAAKIATPSANLKWGNASDDVIRIMKTTYPVLYMGDYKLSGLENTGSHPAVDIKVPTGTPVFAIANGTVVKASTQSSGFGHHIVIRHNNFPSLTDPNAKMVVYSSYSHLSDVLVSVGDVVKKGQQIALSGSTGTATSPHVHFQLDTDDAPWHPFWPFTTQEATAAGLDFFSAINAGLGKENALAVTINPMQYVQKYLNYAGATSYVEPTATVTPPATTDTPVVDTPATDTPATVVPPTETPVTNNTPTENPTADNAQNEPQVLKFTIETSAQYYTGQSPTFFIYAQDQYGKHYEQNFDDSVVATSANGDFMVGKVILSVMDFDANGKATDTLKELKEGKDRIKITYKDQTYYSEYFDIVSADSNNVQLFTDVPLNSKYAEATKYLASNGIVNGYPDGTFKPEKTVTRAEALKLIFEAGNVELSNGNLTFKDTRKSEWYAKYVYTAFKNNVVKGYDDGTFKPANTVTKAEFFKMLFVGMGKNVDMQILASPFKDVKTSDWFAPYVAYAKNIGIVDGGGNFNPTNGMSRGEVADALYRMIKATNS